jgi:uncharacterized protein (TIGR03437 family)
MRFPYLLVTVCASAALAQVAPDLTVASATKQRVELSWTGSAASFTVQRRAPGGTFSVIATVTSHSFSDVIVDPYATYQYQVVAAGASAPSNPVTVGPPPSGFTVVSLAPGVAGSQAAANYGHSLSLAFDANGDPAIAFLYNDPSGDGNPVDTELRFRSWNRAQYRWNNDVRVATVGIVAPSVRPAVSLAYDAGANVFAVATEALGGSIQMFASTDGGAVWTHKATLRTEEPAWGPSLVLAGGNAHFAYNLGGEGVRYLTGRFIADASSWTTRIAPRLDNTELAEPGTAPSLALDSAGNPGIAYWVSQTSNRWPVLLYWRPATTDAPVRVMDGQGQYTAQPVARLLFAGTQPRVATYVQRMDAPFGVGLHSVFSQDGGATWQTPAVIPPDGGTSTDYPFDFSLDSQGRAAIAFGQNGGSNDGVCGNPKLSYSTDLVTWRTCSAADRGATGAFGAYPASIAAAFGANDKLLLVWREANPNSTGVGLLMWRDAPAGEIPAPMMDAGSALNGASYLPGMVAGSWAQVKGVNLSEVTRTWTAGDFTNGNTLPTSLSGVEVRVNNLPAPVYYISPSQISFQVPSGAMGNVTVQAIRNGLVSNTITGLAVASAPGLFTYRADGKIYPAAVFADGALVGDPSVAGNGARRAVPGDRVMLFATGLAPSPAGVVISSASGVSGVTALVGGVPATVEYAGLVAAGEYQINIVVPDLSPGEYPVTIRHNGESSQAGVLLPLGR